MTYGSLNESANRLAHHLQELGVGPETLVGICVQRSIRMVVGILGILKAGGAYVPLDPSYPQARLSFMVSDAEIAVIVSDGESAANVAESTATLFLLDQDWDQTKNCSTENLHQTVHPNNLAYVIYTSGSTGNPKGVLVEHRAILNTLSWLQSLFLLTPDDTIAQKTPASFTDSIRRMQGSQGVGRCIGKAQSYTYSICSATDGRVLVTGQRWPSQT